LNNFEASTSITPTAAATASQDFLLILSAQLLLHTKNQQLRQQPSSQLWPNAQQQQDSHNRHTQPHQLTNLTLPSQLLIPTASPSSSGGTPISPHTMFPYPSNHHHHLPVPPMSVSSTSERTPMQHPISSRGSTANPKRNRTSPPYARIPNGNAGNGLPKQTPPLPIAEKGQSHPI